MNRPLRTLIKEKSDNCCSVCGRWCGDAGSPHHVIKLSEEHLLMNCETNVWWLCSSCHAKTETKPGYNKELQKTLQVYYHSIIKAKKIYTKLDIQNIVNMPYQDLDKAMKKQILINICGKSIGSNVIRFLLGGKIYDIRN